VTDANREMRELWNGPSGERWSEAWQRIDRDLVPIQRAVIAFAAPRAGERVLDVGCGHGTTTLALRERVGDGGAVCGVDISAPLVAIARARTAGTGIRIIEADASDHAFTPEFDLLFSRFGVMFFADPIASFVNLRRALVPGARLAFVCWRSMDDNPWATVPLAAAGDLVPPQPPVDPLAPGMWAFADGARVRDILGSAGFTDIRLEAHDTVMAQGRDVDEAARETIDVGPLARAVTQAGLDDAARTAIAKRVAAALAPYVTADGVNVPAAVWLVGARSP
jgi:SAM-dependent methyltransferase